MLKLNLTNISKIKAQYPLLGKITMHWIGISLKNTIFAAL